MEEINTDQSNLIKEVSFPIYQSRGWMKLIGVLLIIGGVLYTLTIIGIIIAWLPIWMGVTTNLPQWPGSFHKSSLHDLKLTFLSVMNA